MPSQLLPSRNIRTHLCSIALSTSPSRLARRRQGLPDDGRAAPATRNRDHPPCFAAAACSRRRRAQGGTTWVVGQGSDDRDRIYLDERHVITTDDRVFEDGVSI